MCLRKRHIGCQLRQTVDDAVGQIADGVNRSRSGSGRIALNAIEELRADQEAFKSANFGVGASAGVVLFVAIFLLTLLQRATVGRAELG